MIGSFFGTLLLFAPAIVLLGMVAPFAIRLALVDLSSAGQVAGRLYAVSTVGSLFGTFVPALITIPLIGTQRTLLVTAALLAAAASTMLGRRWLVATAAIAALVLVPPGAVKSSDGKVLYEVESPYQFVQVVERDGARRLYLNEGVAVHSLWRSEHGLDRRGLGRVRRAARAARPAPCTGSRCSATRVERSRARTASSGRPRKSTASRSTPR